MTAQPRNDQTTNDQTTDNVVGRSTLITEGRPL